MSDNNNSQFIFKINKDSLRPKKNIFDKNNDNISNEIKNN